MSAFLQACTNMAHEIAAVAASRPVFIPLDLETTVQTIVQKGAPESSPMPYGNDGARAFAGGLGDHLRFYELDPELAEQHLEGIRRFIGGPDLAGRIVCGHNLKFDLQHLHIVPPVLIWDTMVAEYIISGQQAKMTSLSDLQLKYGLPPKRDLIGKNLAAGITPDQIPREELMEYLDGDIINVHRVAHRQFERARELGCIQLILTQGLATQAYACAEYNGMTLDVARCVNYRDYHHTQAALREITIAETVRTLCNVPDGVGSESLTTPRVLSMAFWGVPATASFKVPLGSADSPRGNQKYKSVTISATPAEKAVPYERLGLTMDDLKTGNKWLKLDDAVLRKIEEVFPKSYFADLANDVLAWRRHSKLVGTYYQPLLEHAAKYGDGRVHPTINQCIASTGRTTSERPNAQNMPSEVREVIVPTHSDGMLLEVDFRQLEICALAQISGCHALIAALNGGEDIHYLTGQLVYGYKSKSDETPERRRIIKTINFGLAYGGGAYTLAEQAGVDVQTARNAIEAFYKRFPGTKVYNDNYFEKVVRTPESTAVRLPKLGGSHAVTRREHTMNSCTGRRYVYEEQDTPDWLRIKTGALTSFSPTQTKNYPIQGFATGDIVPLVAGMLMLLPIVRHHIHNLVHDSILFSAIDDQDYRELEMAITGLTNALPTIIGIIWPNITMQVPLRAEIKAGPTWATLSNPLTTRTS